MDAWFQKGHKILGIYLPRPVGVTPGDPHRPPSEENEPPSSALAGSPQALRPALVHIKAPLRAKDFEKIRNARASYRVPAPSRASRKFRVSAASPPPLFLPQGLKGQICRFPPRSRALAEAKEAGTEGRQIRDLFVGRVRWAPRSFGTLLFAPHPLLGTSSPSRSLAGRAGPGVAVRAVSPSLTRPPRLCFSAGQEGVLRCFPDLAGRELQRGALTAESQREHSAAGLTSLGAEERLRLAELNAQYRARFGFPFVLAARLSDREAVLRELARRLHRPPALELRTALGEVKKIGRLRLADLLGADPSRL